MIYITGDVHGPIDIHKFSKSNFIEGTYLTKNDYIIVCGDFGLIWDNNKEELYWRKWLEHKPWITLFIDGNHENFDLLDSFKLRKWHGGLVRPISDSVIYLIRGQIYSIEGRTFFTMGGASSHDKWARKEGKSWWPRELPSVDECYSALDKLKSYNNKVDYIITHCASKRVQNEIDPYFENDSLTNFFDTCIENDIIFKHWYFGHYHIDRIIDDKHTALYDNIIKIGETVYK